MSIRVRLSLLATLAGWFAATLFTLIFVITELVLNTAPGALGHDLAEGLPVWAAFTLLVCAGVWCVVVLPLALLVPAEAIVQRGWQLAAGSSVGAILFIGWRLGTWHDLTEHGAENPINRLFLTYSGFSFCLAWVTTLVYARLLRRVVQES